MKSSRDKVIEKVISRDKIIVVNEANKSAIFESDVFTDVDMLKYLSTESYYAIKETKYGKKLDKSLVDDIAEGMRRWAQSKGVSHYTHWFQPLNGNTAEKHDSFFETSFNSGAIEKFNGSQLLQQESDASSFPNGGLRNTFETRGYSAWDPTSPAFIFNNTLCIPTIFISYSGDALDNKTPLLKSINALDIHATEVIKYFDDQVKSIHPTLGWEQEYFLIDELLMQRRKDISNTGRTLVGRTLIKGQQMNDHYFGSIPSRVLDFMSDLENACLRLGIPTKTRHNEVAPNQFELAPIFEEMNLAVDHNSLLMDVMKKVAEKHNLSVLLHEKPFNGINGSGKHNNWSLATNSGKNLLVPGKTPKSNLQFLTFFINTIKAVNDNEELLRSSVATLGNEHRLGANEAPPAIMSIFIGEELTNILNELTNTKTGDSINFETNLNILDKIPDIVKDNTDRNRTSPFAFTGNKWEFRAVGSTANCSTSMTILNTIVAKQLKDFKLEVDQLISTGIHKDEAILKILTEYITSSRNILYEGNGYSKEWEIEAEKRGLSNNKSTPEALRIRVQNSTISLFEEMRVMNSEELNAKYIIELEDYVNKLKIECLTLADMVSVSIIPDSLKYLDFLYNIKIQNKYISNTIQTLNLNIDSGYTLVENLLKDIKIAEEISELEEKSHYYSNTINKYLNEIREVCDELELVVSDEYWSILKHSELLIM